MSARAVVVAVAVAILGGCAQLGAGPGREPGAERAGGVDGAEALVFVDELALATKAELEAMPAAEPPARGDSRHVLRHALWRATPGHPGHDRGAARRLLEELLAGPHELDRAARALVRIQLRHLRDVDALRTTNARLTRDNARLRAQIRALTDIERDVGDDGGETTE